MVVQLVGEMVEQLVDYSVERMETSSVVPKEHWRVEQLVARWANQSVADSVATLGMK